MSVLLCNGMNRSGSTLQYNLTRLLVERCRAGRAIGAVEAERLDASDLYRRWLAADDWQIIKSHDLPQTAQQSLDGGQMAICYIYRDIRHVAASYKRVWGFGGQALIDELDRAIENYARVQQLQGPILQQRYEDVVADLPAAAAEIAAFLQLDASERLIATVARDCSPQKMQQTTRRLERRLKLAGWLAGPRRLWRYARRADKPKRATPLVRKRRMDARTLLHPNHIGSPHHAASLLSAEEFTTLTERYQPWLQATGYSLQSD